MDYFVHIPHNIIRILLYTKILFFFFLRNEKKNRIYFSNISITFYNHKNELNHSSLDTYYRRVLLFDFDDDPLVEFGWPILSTELDGFVSLSGGSLRFSITTNKINFYYKIINHISFFLLVLYVALSTLTESGRCVSGGGGAV